MGVLGFQSNDCRLRGAGVLFFPDLGLGVWSYATLGLGLASGLFKVLRLPLPTPFHILKERTYRGRQGTLGPGAP